MTAAVLQALLSHWWRRPFQLLTLVLGLGLATALWSGVQAINAEARKSYAKAASVLGGAAELADPSGAPIPTETFVALRRSGWQVSPVIDGWLETDAGRVRLMGIDPLTTPPGAAIQAVASVPIMEFLGPDGAILASPATAERLTSLGARVRAVEGLAPGLAIVDIAGAETLLGQSDYTRLTVAPTQPMRRAALGTVAPGLEERRPDAAEDLARLTDSFHLNLTAFGLLSFAVGLFIVNGAVGLAFEQRRPVFRTLRALGVSARRLVALLLAELMILAALAGALGVALGYLVAAALLPDVAATLRGLYGAAVEGTLTLSPAWWLTGFAIAIAGTAVASLSNLVKVARLKPLATGQPRAWALASGRTRRIQLALAAGCVALAATGSALDRGLAGGFILLGGGLLGAALALPATLSAILELASRLARGPVSTWFWADTRQQLPGLSLALMALLLALSANIGVSTMVGSFRMTFTGWLDQRLASELYVTAETEAEADALVDFLETRADAVLPIWHRDAELLGAPGEIYGIADHPTYRDNWPLLDALPSVWDLIAAGEGALINEQLARREGLAPGDPLPLPGGWRTQVVGIYSDYGNPMAQVILPIDVLTARYTDLDRGSFGVRIAPERAEELRAALIDDMGLPPENVVDQASLKAFSLSVFERTFSVTQALNILTLGVAGIAILTSLLTLASMRLPQLAPVWAAGLPRQDIARLELVRAVALAALTFVLALPVGLALAWVLLAVINVEAFGWRLPLRLFPVDWVWLFILSILAAALAGLWPALRLALRPPADLIRVFANER